jgi:hypothetical protein
MRTGDNERLDATRHPHPVSLRDLERRALRITALRELALVVGAWLGYFGVRALSEGRAAPAFAHARSIVRLERSLGIYWEPALQDFTLDHHLLVTLANWVYIWGHWPVIAGVALWLYRHDRDGYRLLRNAMFISGGIGVFIFAVYPVAPPRLSELGFVDSVTTWSHAYRALQPPSLTNPYAAMPSLHLGWNLLVGVLLVGRAPSPIARIFGALLPMAMVLAVIATANHYIVDVAAGAALALIGLQAARRLAAAKVQPWNHLDEPSSTFVQT